ncbi:MAG: PP0621 family protein [Campylobacterota bacterium]|nr:PP0621 family protein [Campylobacterota bacterium]
MILKLLLLGAVIYGAYFFFFKKKSVSNGVNTSKGESSSMVECKECSTFVSIDEAIISNGEYYCSDECVRVS